MLVLRLVAHNNLTLLAPVTNLNSVKGKNWGVLFLTVSLRCHPRGTKCPVDKENTEILMNDIDAGAYLTERLRSNQPEPYAQEIARTTRRAFRGGLLLGVLSSLVVMGGLVGVVMVNDGGLVETVFGAR